MNKIRRKKVGIITFHKAHNYGALLQAYALKKIVEKMNSEVVFVDVNNESLDRSYRLIPVLKNGSFYSYIKGCAKTLLDLKRKSIRNKVFTKFIETNLPATSLANKEVSLDCVLLGSDQIWNPNITGIFDPVYFGLHPNLSSQRTISYAASMGNGMVTSNFNHKFRELLEVLDDIGVREDSLKCEIKNNFNIDSTQNLDPTLLLTKDEWSLGKDSKLVGEEKYVLVYEVEKHIHTDSVVEKIQNLSGYKVKVISSKTNHKVSKTTITNASPSDFVALFRNASFVVTTSFHGTVFSVINNVPFYTLKFNSGIDNRSAGLLVSLKLDSRHISNIEELPDDYDEINFFEVNKELNILRERSIDYISNNIHCML